MARSPGKVFRLGTEGAEAVQRDFAATGAAGEKMGKRVVEGARGIPPALRAVDTAAGEARKSVEGFAGGAGVLGKVLTSMGPLGLAAAAGVGVAGAAFGALQGAARGAANEMLQLQGAAVQAGVSVEFLQEFRSAIAATGRDVNVIEPALKTFAVRLGEIKSGIGQASLAEFAKVGITEADIRNFSSTEDGLLKLADAIKAVDQQSGFNVADKLGVVDLIPLLSKGRAEIEAMGAQARASGLIIDNEVVARAAETSREWERSSKIIDIQLKQALLDAAPAFSALASFAADVARFLGAAVDSFNTIENKKTATLRARVDSIIDEQQALRQKFGAGVERGSAFDAPGGRLPVTLGPRREPAELQAARERYAELRADRDRAIAELQSRARDATATAPATRALSLPTLPGSGAAGAAVDPRDGQLRSLIEQQDIAVRGAQQLAEAQARAGTASLEEAKAIVALDTAVADLNEARARGIITSDEDLARRVNLVQIAAEEAAAERRRAEAFALVGPLVERTIEPLERYQEQLRALAVLQEDGAISAEQFAEAQRRALAELQGATDAAADGFALSRKRLGEDVDALVSDLGGEIEGALRDGRKLDKQALTGILAQFWRDVLFDAFVAQPLDSLKAQAGSALSGFIQSIFSKVSGGGKSGGGLFSTIIGAVFSGFTGGAGGGKGVTLPKKASGGFGFGRTELGENGLELVNRGIYDLGSGARVFDAASTQAMLSKAAGGGGGGQVVFAPVINADGATAEAVAGIRAALDEARAQLEALQRRDRQFDGRVVSAVTQAKRRSFLPPG